MQYLRHNTTYHRTHFMSGTNCYIFQQHGDVLREFKQKKFLNSKTVLVVVVIVIIIIIVVVLEVAVTVVVVFVIVVVKIL